MKNRHKTNFLFLLAILIYFDSLAQVDLNIGLRKNYEINLEKDISIQIQNSSLKKYELKIVGIVVDNFGSSVQFESDYFNLAAKGHLSFINLQNRIIGFNFNNSEWNHFYKSNNYLPSSVANLCIKLLMRESNEVLGQECQDIVLDIQPPILIYPEDQSIINTINPVLGWLAATNQYKANGITYSIKLSEYLEGVSNVDLLANSPNSFTLNNYIQNSYPYKDINYPLMFKKQYIWQVCAYQGGQKLNCSEIWRFNIDSIKVDKQGKIPIIYIEPLGSSNHKSVKYIGNVPIKYDSDISEGIVRIGLYDPSKRQYLGETISQSIHYGDNRFFINPDDIETIKKNKEYILEFTNSANKSIKYLKINKLK